MKTLVKESVSIYLLQDDEVVLIGESSITVGTPAKFIVADCDSSNTLLFEGVTPPDDWAGGKYLFDGSTWSLNPEYEVE